MCYPVVKFKKKENTMNIKKILLLISIFLFISSGFASASIIETKPKRGDMIVVSETEKMEVGKFLHISSKNPLHTPQEFTFEEGAIIIVLERVERTGVMSDKLIILYEDPEDRFQSEKLLILEKKFSEMEKEYKKVLKMAENYRKIKEKQKILKEFKETNQGIK